MKSSALGVLVTATAVCAVDLKPYVAGIGVPPAFASFVEEYYRTSEDKAATDRFADFYDADGSMILAGAKFTGHKAIVDVKTRLLPPAGNKSWWHLIRASELAGDSAHAQTVVARIVVQTTYVPGNCSQSYGNASFTVAKDPVGGMPRWEPHTQSVLLYNLSVSTTASPTDEPCSTS